ncbi:MAG: class I SAM-dependent methyltransferase [Planctomycetes bacterium]|nr:class I SAM-dependent methyltransferase [Planctomycetota bacterium]
MLQRIQECRACGHGALETFLDLGALPLSDGFLFEKDLAREEPRYPLEVAFCPRCTLVQILHTVPPEELFDADYPYYSSFTQTLLEHSRANVEELIAARGLDARSQVVELASNDGYLLQYYVQRGIPVLGIDPAAGPVRAAVERGVPTRHAFFTRALAEELRASGLQADVVHANNVLAHVADTHGFVAGLAALLKPKGVAVIEVPYVRDLIEHVEFDTIYHEHLCYFSATALAQLFARHGLALQDVRCLPIHGGSLRLFVGHAEVETPAVAELLAAEERDGLTRADYYRSFSRRVAQVRDELRALLAERKQRGQRLAAYGAAAKGTILLNYVGLDRSWIDYVVDRNIHKQGRWVPGVRLPILSPELLLQDRPGTVLLLAWNFATEILAQQSAYLDAGGSFVIPIPRPRLVERGTRGPAR